MFAPNPVPGFHHRSASFHKLYRYCQDAFCEVAQLDSREWQVALVTGSGALALEALFYTAAPRKQFWISRQRAQEEFGSRLLFYAQLHGAFTKATPINEAFVQYETSLSEFRSPLLAHSGASLVVADSVSCFPYALPPPEVDAFVTVSGKLLGAPPGIAFVAARESAWEKDLFDDLDERYSYLNLNRHFVYARRGETPNTPAISLLSPLASALASLHPGRLREKVDARRRALEDATGLWGGEGPVFTFPRFLPFHEELGLYGKRSTQVFLYSGTDEEFSTLLEKIHALALPRERRL